MTRAKETNWKGCRSRLLPSEIRGTLWRVMVVRLGCGDEWDSSPSVDLSHDQLLTAAAARAECVA